MLLIKKNHPEKILGQKTLFFTPNLHVAISRLLVGVGTSYFNTMQVLSMQYARNKKSHPDLILGQKNTFLVYLLYLLIHLGLSAHILTQGISWDELEPFGGFFHFGLGGSIFGA